jgi:hypothetical protein
MLGEQHPKIESNGVEQWDTQWTLCSKSPHPNRTSFTTLT